MPRPAGEANVQVPIEGATPAPALAPRRTLKPSCVRACASALCSHRNWYLPRRRAGPQRREKRCYNPPCVHCLRDLTPHATPGEVLAGPADHVALPSPEPFSATGCEKRLEPPNNSSTTSPVMVNDGGTCPAATRACKRCRPCCGRISRAPSMLAVKAGARPRVTHLIRHDRTEAQLLRGIRDALAEVLVR